jgi:hypothetical protein
LLYLKDCDAISSESDLYNQRLEAIEVELKRLQIEIKSQTDEIDSILEIYETSVSEFLHNSYCLTDI